MALWFGLHAFVAAQAYKALGSSPFKRNAMLLRKRNKERKRETIRNKERKRKRNKKRQRDCKRYKLFM